ncbi:MAG: CinA family protein [Bowdeniella nasicola]|nr:CinA family protein [Bowdeniella nasicola]
MINADPYVQFTASAQRLVAALGNRSLAVAESLTAGMVSAAIANVPGVSAIYRGAVVSYATEVKTSVLQVPTSLISVHTPVSIPVAEQMARGIAQLLSADAALATTGVAGPGPAWGKPAGTVVIAALLDGHVTTRELQLSGDRAAVRTAATLQALALLSTLGEQNRSTMCY